jgi:hypothetical protein
MIPKSGCRFSERIVLKQQAKAKCRFNQKSFRFSVKHDRAVDLAVNPGLRAASVRAHHGGHESFRIRARTSCGQAGH